MGLLNQWGEPIVAPDVEKEVSGILDSFGRWQDVGNRWAGDLLQYQDTVLLEEGGNTFLAYEIYERVLTDNQVSACLQQRFGIQQEYDVIPGDSSRKAKKAAEAFKQNLSRLQWDLITYQMKFGIYFGKSVAEILWETTEDGFVNIKDIKVRDRRRFRFGTDMSLRLIGKGHPFSGLNLSKEYPSKFWVFSYGGTHSDMPDGLGLAHYLYWPVTFKRQGIRFWLFALEKYGTNIPIGYYPPGITEEERIALNKALAKIKQNSAISVPDGTKIEFLSGTGGIDNYEKLVRWCDDAIAKVILTSTMTLEDGSSRAQAEVHQSETNNLTDTDNDLLCESFNRSVLTWWSWFNYGDVPPPKLLREHEGIDTYKLANRDKILFDLGYPPTPEYVLETYGKGFVRESQLQQRQDNLSLQQIESLTSLLAAGSRGDLPLETLKVVLTAGFPSLSAELIEQMLNPLRRTPEKASDTSSEQEPKSTEDEPDNSPKVGSNNSPVEFELPPTEDVMAETLESLADPLFSRIFEQIGEEIEKCQTLEEVSAILDSIYPKLDSDALIKVFSEALFAAQLAGLAEVQNESKS